MCKILQHKTPVKCFRNLSPYRLSGYFFWGGGGVDFFVLLFVFVCFCFLYLGGGWYSILSYDVEIGNDVLVWKLPRLETES